MFYENFERLCKQAGLSPSAAVQKINLNKNASGAWKKYHTIPKEQQLIQLAELLNCQVSDFFADPAAPRYPSYERMVEMKLVDGEWEVGGDFDENEREILSAYGKMSNRERNEFMNIVYEFIDLKDIEL